MRTEVPMAHATQPVQVAPPVASRVCLHCGRPHVRAHGAEALIIEAEACRHEENKMAQAEAFDPLFPREFGA